MSAAVLTRVVVLVSLRALRLLMCVCSYDELQKFAERYERGYLIQAREVVL